MTEKPIFPVLAQVDNPADIRGLELPQLNKLAEEIRELIIRTVSVCGGHLSSSLGTVELTLALHYVFSTPADRLIWDVGHQAYAHKIITQRKERFHTLRQKGGISGFPRREESVYDVFTVGHSSTSISAAAGIAEARCLKGEDFKVVAVIGDGSMSAGMAFEGLNWSGDRKKDLVIVLNDNELSISPNVGAMSSYLNRIMTAQGVTRFKKDIKGLLRAIPGIGEHMLKFSRQLEEALKSFLVPGALFEELGFTYVGPLEGHRLDHLIKNFENIREMQGPVLVHVVTKKGKGYRYAEEDPQKYHGIAPFRVETGSSISGGGGTPSYTKVFGDALVRLARENPAIVAITAAMCEGTGLDLFAREFPKRFYDVGIAEQHGVTFAAGLAVESLLPVVAIYSTFVQRAYDQITHDVCLQNLPLVLALDRGGFVGADGPTHHGLFDLAFLRSLPNMVIMSPKDENELRHMLKTALECGGPAAIRYPRGGGIGVDLDDEIKALPVGRGEIIREGVDLAVIAIGATVYPANAAAERLAAMGIDLTVINARFVKPLDDDLILQTARTHKKIITVEENVLMGGFGSAILELLADRGINDVAVKRIGIPDEFVEHASQQELRSQYGIDEAGIMASVMSMIERPGGGF
ncbi:MAG: 1-deoxy-D-xylulose-5-phosphate synthase [Smithellaceae bacterium]|nr:1-deoxy-D-xylulose-5-phosphate synthase [Smithellaceae bacterium]